MGKKVKLRPCGSSLVITIPKDIIEVKGWNEGDILELEDSGINALLLKKS